MVVVGESTFLHVRESGDDQHRLRQHLNGSVAESTYPAYMNHCARIEVVAPAVGKRGHRKKERSSQETEFIARKRVHRKKESSSQGREVCPGTNTQIYGNRTLFVTAICIISFNTLPRVCDSPQPPEEWAY
jgi:hypothetical protein